MFWGRYARLCEPQLSVKVAVVGIGRVGLPFAAVASKHFDTVGIDVDPVTVGNINERRQSSEPGVNEYLSKYGLRASTDFGKIRHCDLVFICVGSQSGRDGYSAKNLMAALENVSPYLVSKGQVLVVMTTLPPLSIERELVPYLSANGVLGRISGLCYNPTMVALGNALSDFEHPNYVLIGESNPEAGKRLQSFWAEIAGEEPRTFRSTFSNVAMAKYALNTALTLKITLLNVLTELCENVGADIDFQSDVMKADPRIAGQKMFKGGMGFGGTCFPVDAEAFRVECEKRQIPTDLAETIQSLNRRQVERSVSLIKSFGRKKVAILGITYKPGTSIVEASQPLEIAEQLAQDGYELVICDPEGLENARRQLGNRAVYTSDTEKALAFANVVFIGVEWTQFRDLTADSFRRDQVVIDPWRVLRAMPLNCKYVPYGIGP